MKTYVFTVGGVWVSEPIQVVASSLEEAIELLDEEVDRCGYNVSEQEITETTLVNTQEE